MSTPLSRLFQYQLRGDHFRAEIKLFAIWKRFYLNFVSVFICRFVFENDAIDWDLEEVI